MELAFEKNKNLFDDQLSVGINIASDIDDHIAKALAQDTALSEVALPMVLADGEVTASGPSKEFRFKEVPNLSIAADASAEMRIALYDSAAETTKDLLQHDNLSFDLPVLNEEEVYGIFAFAYSIHGDVEGEWPLGKVSLTAGVDASTRRRGATVMRMKKSVGLKKSLITLISSLQSPRAVERAGDLAPGTFLIMECEGSLDAQLGAKVGFDFDWTAESQNEQLPGTLGLQAKLGATINLGLSLAGEFSVVLSRPTSAHQLHLQLAKRKQNGWNFAAGLNASAKGDLADFEDFSVEDLIQATIGIHHGQILEDLRSLRKNLDPAELEQALHGITDDILKRIAGVDQVADARALIVKMLDKWDTVGEEGASAVLGLVKESTEVDLVAVKEKFETLGSTNDVPGFLEEQLAATGFHETGFGKVLESLVPYDDLFELVAEQEWMAKVQKKSTEMAELLDIEKVIRNFHQTVSEELALAKIKKAAASDSLEPLGDWLKEKLSSLTQGDLTQELEQISQFITKLEENAAKILENVKKALQKEYGVALAFAYQKEREHSALIDAVFDFGVNEQLTDILSDALDGQYNDLLANTTIAGVTLNNGLLTHRLSRQRTLSLTVPGTKRNFKRINQSITTGKFIDEKDGRLMMYELEASDVIRKKKRMIQLALSGDYFGKKQPNGFFGLEKASLKLSFSSRMQNRKFKTRHLEQVIEPFIRTSLSKPFAAATSLSTDEWLHDLDTRIERVNGNGKRVFGKTLVNMELRVPPQVGAAWLGLPANKKHPVYKAVSAAIQERLRALVHLFAFESEEVFTKAFNREKLQAVLLYTSLPVLKRRQYNYQDLIDQPGTLITRLSRSIMLMVKQLQQDPDEEMRKAAEAFFDVQASVQDILHKMKHDTQFVQLVEGLVSKESNTVRRVIKTGTKLAAVKTMAADKPKEATKQLTEFGAELADILNDVHVIHRFQQGLHALHWPELVYRYL